MIRTGVPCWSSLISDSPCGCPKKHLVRLTVPQSERTLCVYQEGLYPGYCSTPRSEWHCVRQKARAVSSEWTLSSSGRAVSRFSLSVRMDTVFFKKCSIRGFVASISLIGLDQYELFYSEFGTLSLVPNRLYIYVFGVWFNFSGRQTVSSAWSSFIPQPATFTSEPCSSLSHDRVQI